MPFYLATLLALALVTHGHAQTIVTKTQSFQHPDTGIHLLGGEIVLPSAGVWSLVEQETPDIKVLSLVVPDLISQRSQGERVLKKQERMEREKDRHVLQRLYRLAEKYAREHEGVAPASLELIEALKTDATAMSGNYFLIPSTQILDRQKKGWRRLPGKPLILELNPLIDDGQHWVAMSDGRVSLVPIDNAIIEQYGLIMEARQPPVEKRLAEIATSVSYRIVGRASSARDQQVALVQLVNRETGDTLQVEWSLGDAAPGDEQLPKQWATHRVHKWRDMQQDGVGGLLPYWIDAVARQYGVDPNQDLGGVRGNRMREDRQANLFHVLGGRAAIRETLQLQRLNAQGARKGSRTVPVSSIKGVEVKSHPFEAMLAGQDGGQLALANHVPVDRFFAYFADPSALLQYLDGGSHFIADGGSSFSGTSNDYQLHARYLERLGVDETWARRFLETVAVGEVAVVMPDLFLIDGTDITVLMRMRHPAVAKGMLKLFGIGLYKPVYEHTNSSGDVSYWALQDDLLLISTHRKELEDIQRLKIDGNDQSLGRSAEFRYMLTQLPIERRTRSFFYFSDPFIRRLVGPQVKIAQLRRLQAKAELEAATGALLLYRLDGNQGTPSLDELVAKKYMPPPVLVEDISLAANGQARSKQYGSPARLNTLLTLQVKTASAAEKRAYERYLNNYNRFWRQFFDPIALRVNQAAAKELELSTFILPLIDNSIYQTLRDVLVEKDGARALAIPALQPEPVAMLSLNLKQAMWDEGAEMLQDFLLKFVGLPPRIIDFFGPDLHLALGDGDPIVVMGSGELTGALGMLGGTDRAGQALMIPLIGSLLTRPTALFIGLTDPEAVRGLLHGLRTGPLANSSVLGLGVGKLYGVAGKDAWRYDLNIAGLLSMRFGMELKDRYLAISNQPLSFDPQLVAIDTTPAHGAAISLAPAAAIRQRPALFASASDKQRRAAMSGLGVLYPLLAAGADSVEQAQQQATSLLGYRPVHPGRGKWSWRNGTLSSNVFGSPARQFQADYQSDDEAFGILHQVTRLSIAMQFENDGLRAVARWELTE